jgi:hypothetical protein
MIGSPDCATGLPDGRWVRAVPLPYFGTPFERLHVAWWVFTGRAYAVEWPKAGDLEKALNPLARRTTLAQAAKDGGGNG